MVDRLVLFLMCACVAGVLHAAPTTLSVSQDYEEEESEPSELNLAVPDPVLRGVPSLVTSGPMGHSPLTQPAPGFAPTVIAAPSHEEAVERNSLAAPVLTTYGVLDERSGSLPMDVWKTLTYRDALAVLTTYTQRVVAGHANAMVNDMLRVAALSRTYEPIGSAELAGAYFNARVMAAQMSGDTDGALALFRMQPSSFNVQDWQTFIENEVRLRHMADVCAISADKLAQDISPFAQKMSIVCDIKNGKAETARLHLDLLREAKDGDALFLELAERALNPGVVLKNKHPLKLEQLSTLQVAALTLGKSKLKPEQMDRLMEFAQPLLLDVPMGDAQRLGYAETFARRHRITAQDYQAILASVTFPSKAIAQFRARPETLLTVPEKEWPAPLRRAAAFRAMAEEDNPTQKAHIVAAAMAGLSNADLLGPLGDCFLASVAELEALPDTVAAAPAMARLLLARGNPQGASWWRLASASPENRDALLPIFPLALLRHVIKEDDLPVWFERYGRTQTLSGEKKNITLAMVKILGVMLPSDEDSRLAAQGVFPATHAIDRRMDVLMGNIASATSEALLRALLALKAMRQNALAEKWVVLNL